MTREPILIHVEPTSELAEALGEGVVLLESKGVVYVAEPASGSHRQSDPHDLLAKYDPERARVALRASAGALRGVDVEKLKKELREQRD
jgi:hypothetical protein